MNDKTKHTKAWFFHRVGKEVIKDPCATLFNPPIRIDSKDHARALYISQTEKGWRYSEV